MTTTMTTFFSALEVFKRYALYKSTFYLLTYTTNDHDDDDDDDDNDDDDESVKMV